MKKYLIFMQQNPYANSKAMEALEFALAISSFNQQVTLIFKDDGVLQLLAKPEVSQLVLKDFTKVYAGLHLFGIDKVYVDQNSMRDYVAEDFLITPHAIEDETIAAMIKDHDVVMMI